MTFGHVHSNRGRSSISSSSSSSMSTSSVPPVSRLPSSVIVMSASRASLGPVARRSSRWSTYLPNGPGDRQVPGAGEISRRRPGRSPCAPRRPRRPRRRRPSPTGRSPCRRPSPRPLGLCRLPRRPCPSLHPWRRRRRRPPCSFDFAARSLALSTRSLLISTPRFHAVSAISLIFLKASSARAFASSEFMLGSSFTLRGKDHPCTRIVRSLPACSEACWT